jgi:hypothetical protein
MLNPGGYGGVDAAGSHGREESGKVLRFDSGPSRPPISRLLDDDPSFNSEARDRLLRALRLHDEDW